MTCVGPRARQENSNFDQVYSNWFGFAASSTSPLYRLTKYILHFRWHMATGKTDVCSPSQSDRRDGYGVCGSHIKDWMNSPVYVELQWAKALRERKRATK